MDTIIAGLLVLALAVSGLTLAAFGWSMAHPERSIWPPKSYSFSTPIVVWGVTCILFGTIIALGIIGWGEANVGRPLRFGLGPLIS